MLKGRDETKYMSFLTKDNELFKNLIKSGINLAITLKKVITDEPVSSTSKQVFTIMEYLKKVSLAFVFH